MRLIYLIVFFSFYYFIKGQNLVQNPSFEDTLHCPNGGNQIFNAQYWTNPSTGSPDYLNSCATCCGGSIGVPNNGAGSQVARTGVAYGGIYTYNPVNREYLQNLLLTALIGNHKYLVSFYVSLADYPEYSTNTIGVYFSPNAVSNPTSQILPYTPQIQNKSSNPLTDKNNWMLIQDTLYAVGGEKYMIIGNFEPDSLSDTLNVGPFTGVPSSYYYVDDISVIDYGPMGVQDYNYKSSISVYPNPNMGIFRLQSQQEIGSISIYNTLGELLLQQNIKENATSIDIASKPSGIYFLRTDNKVIKIVSDNKD